MHRSAPILKVDGEFGKKGVQTSGINPASHPNVVNRHTWTGKNRLMHVKQYEGRPLIAGA